MSIAIPAATLAANIAIQLQNQANALALRASNLFTSGQPAQGNNPAITGDNIITQLGSVGEAQFKLLIAAVNTVDPSLLAAALSAITPTPTPTPTATPTPTPTDTPTPTETPSVS